ncbi:1179_t:CDS:1, partial [Funneliformis geosporum]
SQKIEITKEYNSGIDAVFDTKKDKDIENVVEILSHIVRVLQAQANAVGNDAKRQRNN